MDIVNTGAHLVWGPRAAAPTVVDHPLTPALDAREWEQVRVAIEMFGRVGTLQAQAYYEVSQDGVNWTLPGMPTVGPLLTADGVSYDSTPDSLSGAASSRYLRFGVRAYNASGTDLNTAYVSLRLEANRA